MGPLRIPRHLVEQYCCHNYRQHNSGCLYEGRGGGDEVGPSLCPSLGNPDLVFQETGDCSLIHSRRLNDIAHQLSSLTQLDRADRMVPPVRVFSKQYASGGTRPNWPVFYRLAQQQTLSTCFTGDRSPNMDNDTISLPWEDLDPYGFPLVAILGKWWRSCRTTHAGESL